MIVDIYTKKKPDPDKDIFAALLKAAAQRDKVATTYIKIADEQVPTIKIACGPTTTLSKDVYRSTNFHIVDKKPTPEDIADIQAQLAATANDPNLTIITEHHWDVPGSWASRWKLVDATKEAAIEQALSTDEGRIALAKAMMGEK